MPKTPGLKTTFRQYREVVQEQSKPLSDAEKYCQEVQVIGPGRPNRHLTLPDPPMIPSLEEVFERKHKNNERKRQLREMTILRQFKIEV